MFQYIATIDGKFMILDTNDGVSETVDLDFVKDVLRKGWYIDRLHLREDGEVEDCNGYILGRKYGDDDSFNERSGNRNLARAKRVKNDEFYTQLCDIEKELSHYPKECFKDKVVYLPCDRAIANSKIPVSNFVVYFKEHFEELGIKKLIVSWLEDDPSKNNCVIFERD